MGKYIETYRGCDIYFYWAGERTPEPVYGSACVKGYYEKIGQVETEIDKKICLDKGGIWDPETRTCTPRFEDPTLPPPPPDFYPEPEPEPEPEPPKTGWNIWPLSAVRDWFNELWDNVLSYPFKAARWLWNGLVDSLSDLWDGISEGLGWLWGKVKPIIKDILSGLEDLDEWLHTGLDDAGRIAAQAGRDLRAWWEGGLADAGKLVEKAGRDTRAWLDERFHKMDVTLDDQGKLYIAERDTLVDKMYLGGLDWVSQAIDGVAEKVGQGFQDFFTWFVEGLEWFATSAADKVGKVRDALEETMDSLMPNIFEKATEALKEGSPPKEIQESVEKFIKQLMEMVEKESKTKGESLPTMVSLLGRQAKLAGGIVGMYALTHAISIALDASQPFKDWGFKSAVMDIMYQFDMSKVIGPMFQAPIWSSVVTPMRMRANESYPYQVPGTGLLPYLRAKDLIDDPTYKTSMKYAALDEDWSGRLLANTARYPSFSELRTMIHRGAKTWEEAQSAFKMNLVPTDYMDAYEEIIPNIPGVSDLVRFAVREAYPDATTFQEHYAKMTAWIGRIGYSTYFADAYWTAHWIIPTTGQADEMLHRGMITVEEHRALYILNDIRPQDIDNLRALTWKMPGRIEARWMFRYNEIDVTGLRDLLVKDGLDPAYGDRVARAVAKNQFLALINREIANIKADYARGYSVEEALREDLQALDIHPTMVEFHVMDALADRERSIHDEELRTLRSQYARGALKMADVMARAEEIILDEVARDAWIAALPTAKQVMIVEETYATEVNRLVANAKYDYVRGYITKQDMVGRFTLLDLPDEVIEFHVMDADEDRARKRNDERLIVIKDMWMKDVETDFDVITGWVDPIIVEEEARELWLADTYFDKLKAPLRPPAPPRLPTVTLATLTRAFREGIITEAQLRAELTNRRYSREHIEIMIAVEKTRMAG